MKKELMYFAMISLILLIPMISMGCGGKSKEDPNAGQGYTLTVNPRNVVGGGTVVIDLRITNQYETDMLNAEAKMYNVPTGYDGADDDPLGGTTISKGQTIPSIWTISVPDTNLRESFSPKIEVCFDYTTEYMFQSAFRQARAVGEVELASSVTRGPITVATIGSESIFVRNEAQTRSVTLDIRNAANGYIHDIKSLKFEVPSALNIVRSGNLVYTTCNTGIVNPGQIAELTTSCENFGRKQVVSQGITAKVELSTNDASNVAEINPVIDRMAGSVDYTYCFEIPVGSITVCPAGQVC